MNNHSAKRKIHQIYISSFQWLNDEARQEIPGWNNCAEEIDVSQFALAGN